MSTTEKMPSISIITPVFNGARYLDALILSIQRQEYLYAEHIVIDDGSTDQGATIAVLKGYNHLRWWSRENRGQYATMNDGLQAASGEVVCFISADDLMTPDSIWTAVNFLSSNKEFVGVYGSYSFINSDGKRLSQFHPMRYMPTLAYPYSLHIAHSSLYLLREFLVQNDLYFDSSLKYVGDYDWLVRILRTGHKIGRLRHDLSLIRLHEQQASMISFYRMQQENRVVQKKLGISLFWASAFRKLMFFIGVVNLLKRKGLAPTFQMLLDRFMHLRDA